MNMLDLYDARAQGPNVGFCLRDTRGKRLPSQWVSTQPSSCLKGSKNDFVRDTDLYRVTGRPKKTLDRDELGCLLVRQSLIGTIPSWTPKQEELLLHLYWQFFSKVASLLTSYNAPFQWCHREHRCFPGHRTKMTAIFDTDVVLCCVLTLVVARRWCSRVCFLLNWKRNLENK